MVNLSQEIRETAPVNRLKELSAIKRLKADTSNAGRGLIQRTAELATRARFRKSARTKGQGRRDRAQPTCPENANRTTTVTEINTRFPDPNGDPVRPVPNAYANTSGPEPSTVIEGPAKGCIEVELAGLSIPRDLLTVPNASASPPHRVER